MSNISNQLVKDTYNYVLQSDLITGIVYRIGGAIPINPWFQSGLTISGGFTFADSPQSGYVLTSDAVGNASWQPVSAATSNIPYITGGTYDSNTGILSLVNQTGGTISVSGLNAADLRYFVQDTSPTGTTINGDRWFNTNTGVELVWINDGDSGQWIQPGAVYPPLDFDVLYGGNY